MMVVDDESSSPAVTRANLSRDGDPPLFVPTQLLSQEPPPKKTETRPLLEIVKEEMQELVISHPPEPEKSRRPRKPKETKKFVSRSLKGKLRVRRLLNFHMPFGSERRPRVDLGTLEEAMRKLGLEPSS